MIDVIIRGLPYYFIFILLFIIYRKYNYVLLCIETAKKGILVGSRNSLDGLNRYEKSRQRLLLCAYLILLLFLGFRGYVYTDFVNYKPFFDLLDGFKSIPEVLLIKGWEPGFVAYSALCKAIFPNYFAWNIISTAIDLFLLHKILERYSNNHLLSLLVFFVIGATALEFNVLRNAKAIFLFLYSIRYIEERKMWKYFAVIGLACLFHISSVLYFPLYFILNKKWSKWILWLIYIGGAVVLIFHINFISDIVSKFTFAEGGRLEYLTSHLENSSAYTSIFGTIERLITMFFVIYLYDKLSRIKQANLIFLNMYILLYAVFSFCAESNVMVQRFQYMFIGSFWILYPLLIWLAKTQKKQFIYLFVTAMIFLKMTLIAADPNLKYENVITGTSNFNVRVKYTERNLGL